MNEDGTNFQIPADVPKPSLGTRGGKTACVLVRPEMLLALAPKCCDTGCGMTTKITHWKEPDGRYLGYLNAYPDHWTQGDDLNDLKEQLRDLHQTFSMEEIPSIRKEEELEVA
jgi:predicted RNase H-like HicB family nuclease